MVKKRDIAASVTPHTQARDLIYAVWRAISWDQVSPMRRMKIYDEFTSKIKSAAGQPNLARFVERLCAKMGIRSIAETAITPTLAENSEVVLDLLRNETQYVVLMMREVIETKQAERAEEERAQQSAMSSALYSGIEEVHE